MSIKQGNNTIAGGIVVDNTPTSGSPNAVSSGGVYTALSGKVNTGHEVIDYQAPTSSNNYTWYRKYADGWVEQGGVISGAQRVNLPIAMSDANYCVLGTYVATGIVSGAMGLNPDSTGFYANTATATRWYVSGMAA